MKHVHNAGTIVGGSIGVGAAVAGGTGARAEANSGLSADSLAALLRELREAIASDQDQVADPDALLAAADRVEKEVGKAEPNRSLIRSLLAGIRDASGSAAQIATAAATLAAVL